MGGLRMRWLATLGAALVLLTVIGPGCGSGDDTTGAASTTTAVAAPRDFSERGPYRVGAIRLQLDAARPVEVFYPADADAVPPGASGYRYTPEEVWGPLLAALPPGVVSPVDVPDTWFDIPAADGHFPLVVISHGFGMMRFSYTFHAAHLASWGYVVASPEHPTRDLHARLGGATTAPGDPRTALDTVALLGTENGKVGSVLEGKIDTDRVAVEGHSMGGRDAGLSAYDAVVDTWIGLAPVVPIPDDALAGHDIIGEGEDGFDPAAGDFDLAGYLRSATPPDKPSMLLVADRDVAFPTADRRAVFDWLPQPKRYVLLANTGHSVFVNDCEAIQEHGGSTIADALHFGADAIERRVLENGCLPTYTPVEDVWAAWDHLTVAQLDWVFDIDGATAAASLEHDYLDATFPGVIAEYVTEP